MHFVACIAAAQQMGITHILTFATNNRLRNKEFLNLITLLSCLDETTVCDFIKL